VIPVEPRNLHQVVLLDVLAALGRCPARLPALLNKSKSFDQALELTTEDEFTSPLLPGFVLPLSALFA
jgi:hypothetical protein